MPTIFDYALMAGASYISTRAEINQFPVPTDWTEQSKGSETFSFLELKGPGSNKFAMQTVETAGQDLISKSGIFWRSP